MNSIFVCFFLSKRAFAFTVHAWLHLKKINKTTTSGYKLQVDLTKITTIKRVVEVHMGRYNPFPPWEDYFKPLDQIKNTILSYTFNTILFSNTFHHPSLSFLSTTSNIKPSNILSSIGSL
jgi:hypothetical protein